MYRTEIVILPPRKPRSFWGIILKLFLISFVGAGVWGGMYFAAWLGHRTAINAPVETFTPTPEPTAIATSKTPPLVTPFRVLGTLAESVDFPTETAVPYEEPPSQLVDGLLTYGQEQPLKRSELTNLIGFLNTNPLPMEEDTYYVTFLASETAFQTFSQSEGEDLQTYLMRHVAWMDRALKAADPPVEGGLVVRRLVILQDGAFGSELGARGFDYSAHGLLDSDGSWSFIDPYLPKSSGFYNTELELDTGLTHEWIHSVFHLPDHYGLDYHPKYDRYGVLAGIPEEWRRYLAGRRPDISYGDFAMGGAGYMLRHYSALQLVRRQLRGVVHDPQEVGAEHTGFAPDMPQEVLWDFGQEFADAHVLVYQTEWADLGGHGRYDKVLSPHPVFVGQLDELGRVNVGGLFGGYETWVPHPEGVLFVKVVTSEGIWFRWMDIRDFNLAHWHGFTDSVLMKMGLASFGDDPDSFDWTIRYEDAGYDEPSASD